MEDSLFLDISLDMRDAKSMTAVVMVCAEDDCVYGNLIGDFLFL